MREAQRVGRLRNMKVSDVVDRAARGDFRFGGLRRLTMEALPAIRAAIDILRQVDVMARGEGYQPNSTPYI